MKQLLILSGKGGTGKTTIASAFIKLSEAMAYADCDVDAPNLHLIMEQASAPVRTDYQGLPKAEIDTVLCTKCGQCAESCRFKAISADPNYSVNPFVCEGCGVCEFVCAYGAVSMKQAAAGELILYAGCDRVFSTAELKIGSGTSGKLVAEVKKQMKSYAADAGLAIIDGSPGIGCPVIASLSGIDMVLVVAEPSVSGISDMNRIIDTAGIFKIKTAVCINKYDTNLENSSKIESFCNERSLPVAGMIPFDTYAVTAINSGQSIVDADCISGRAVIKVFDRTMEILYRDDPGSQVR